MTCDTFLSCIVIVLVVTTTVVNQTTPTTIVHIRQDKSDPTSYPLVVALTNPNVLIFE